MASCAAGGAPLGPAAAAAAAAVPTALGDPGPAEEEDGDAIAHQDAATDPETPRHVAHGSGHARRRGGDAGEGRSPRSEDDPRASLRKKEKKRSPPLSGDSLSLSVSSSLSSMSSRPPRSPRSLISSASVARSRPATKNAAHGGRRAPDEEHDREEAAAELDEELEEILGRVDACAQLSRSLVSERGGDAGPAGEDADTLLRRSLDVSMELQMVAARFSAMWGSQVRARRGPAGEAATSLSARERRLNLGKATRAVQKCFDAERQGLLREIRALEARNRKCGMTIRGLETRKEREEHLAKRCRTLQERADDLRAGLDACKRQLERSQTGAAETERVRRLLESEVVQLRREKQALEAKLEACEHEAGRTLREQTRELARSLEAEREAHAAAREGWHQSKLEAELIRRQVDIKETALRDKDRLADEAADALREATGALRTKLKQAENRAFAAEEMIAGARAEADGVRAELTEQLSDLRAKLSRTEALRQNAELEAHDLREQVVRRRSGSEDCDAVSLQRQVARLCEANTSLRAERDRAEKTSERALGALRQARLLEETVSSLRAQIRDRDETIHQLTVHYRAPEEAEQVAAIAALEDASGHARESFNVEQGLALDDEAGVNRSMNTSLD